MLRPSNKNKGIPTQEEKQQAIVLPLHTSNRPLDFLVDLFETVRPDTAKDIAQATVRFKALLYQLSQDKSLLFSLRKALLAQFVKANIIPALTENGILSSRGFVHQVGGKLLNKVLPERQTQDNFLYVINRVFHKKRDFIWVEGIDDDLWIQFFEILAIQIDMTEPVLISESKRALQILSYRIITQGLEKEIAQRYESFANAALPFFEQNRLVNEYVLLNNDFSTTDARRILLVNIDEALQLCNQTIQRIRDQRIAYGTSLAQTIIISRLQQQIDRLFIILNVLDTDNSFNTERFVAYFKTVVHSENRKNSIREFLSNSTYYLACQISEHGGRSGGKFISSTRNQIRRMFVSSMGGGLIISFIAVIKNLLAKVIMPPFWHGFLNSVNYSLGFILMQDTSSTLATKQPAYTANSVASSLDIQKAGKSSHLKNLAITVGKVSRTQIASIAGNVLVAFPLTFFLAWLFFMATGVKIAEGAAAHQLIINQQPTHGLAWLYACFTGFFLFASGIIAGFVENYLIYEKVAERLYNMPSFKKRFSEKARYRILHYVENNLGSLIGNISLGLFLGMAGFIGQVFAIPFDIRHITISAANTAIGFFGIDHTISAKEILYTIIGVLGIGFFNFAVSFGLAFMVALKSRGIRLKDYPQFLGILFRYFKKYPFDFIKAPIARNTEQL